MQPLHVSIDICSSCTSLARACVGSGCWLQAQAAYCLQGLLHTLDWRSVAAQEPVYAKQP